LKRLPEHGPGLEPQPQKAAWIEKVGDVDQVAALRDAQDRSDAWVRPLVTVQ
jgi:hypothetical protein